MFPKSLFPIALLSIISLGSVSAVDYSETYVGCVPIGTGTSGALYSPSVYSIEDCNFACADAGYTYAYFSNPASSFCSCKNTGPAPGDISSVASGNTNCGSFQATVNALATDYSFQSCYNSPASDDTTSQSTFDSCFERCSTYTNALVAPAGTTYTCLCSNTTPSGTAESCGYDGTFFAYSHTAISSPSLVDRRRRRLERMKRDEQLRLNRFCPGGLQACIVPGSDDSFECIDTSSELESCGGCLYGSYTNSTAPAGVDCSILRGAAFGGATCANGRCEISACREGFQLVDGKCQ
ncbi:hypothetical protein V866_002754 [Kwoniella sp. B9012]